MLNHVLRPITRNFIRSGSRSSSSKVVDIKLPTINDIPGPCGPWKKHYDARQKVYNAQLIAGVGILISTIAYIKISGAIFFNFGPPEEPIENK
ncbi:PREDICTED: uncharacterized protein LOC108746569 [Trachymyrmex septentrionalis]|uniref:uncharacterized protein LOC108746569 n=1 Tax=Trachymyrmex septentrionalis TaxID=34720 RepID=UPI00084F34AE|nr:PREDICTED: uncharacterized protein LOC108746569 [Trachymyrmex septentrionalis]